MKYAWFIALLLLLASCDRFDVKKTSSEEILNEELQTFKWNEVDVYPTFSACDTSTTKEEKEACFVNVLNSHLTDYLAKQHFVVTQDIQDTLLVKFIISDKGEALISDIEVNTKTIKELPNIKDVLIKSLDSLPQIYPALKRGQQVTSQFTLPIVIGVN
jgi:hypothetical protein